MNFNTGNPTRDRVNQMTTDQQERMQVLDNRIDWRSFSQMQEDRAKVDLLILGRGQGGSIYSAAKNLAYLNDARAAILKRYEGYNFDLIEQLISLYGRVMAFELASRATTGPDSLPAHWEQMLDWTLEIERLLVKLELAFRIQPDDKK